MRRLAKIDSCWIVAILLAGCTARHYRRSADKEVYKIIQEKQEAALGQTNVFSIDTPENGSVPTIGKTSFSILRALYNSRD
jgi:hypothetical protein